jgi:hypothetical protein
MNPEPTENELTPTAPVRRRRHPHRVRRALAIAAGVAMVPALYAAASAATGGGGGASTVQVGRAADDLGTSGPELATEHGVVVEKPHGGATTPSVPDSTSPIQPQATTPTTPEQEIEHPVPEPGDDSAVGTPGDTPGDASGDDSGDGGVSSPVPSGEQSFSSVGGSITIDVTNGVLSLTSSSPAPGFGVEVHDNGPSRVEVRFSDGQTEWRIRIELGAGGLTSEITQDG